MRNLMVRYTVKRWRARENERLIKAAFREMKRKKLKGLRYAAFKLEDGLTFVHVVSMAGRGNPLAEVAAFKKFAGTIRERTRAKPTFTDLRLIGAHGLFD